MQPNSPPVVLRPRQEPNTKKLLLAVFASLLLMHFLVNLYSRSYKDETKEYLKSIGREDLISDSDQENEKSSLV